jgi:hypothetical protein
MTRDSSHSLLVGIVVVAIQCAGGCGRADAPAEKPASGGEPWPNVRLMHVIDIQQHDAETVVHFLEGPEVQLQLGTQGYDDYVARAAKSFEKRQPLAVSTDQMTGTTRLDLADKDPGVQQVTDHDNRTLRVLFKGHAGIYYLRKDHPEFARIKRTLDQSAKCGTWVWFAASLPASDLDDVLPDELDGPGDKR